MGARGEAQAGQCAGRVNDGTADGAPAPAAVQDALLAAKWCWDYMDYFHGDRAHYVVTGASAGGHLALMVGMTTADAGLGPTSPTDFKIAGIVDGYGPADIEAEIDGVAKGWLPASLPNRLAIAKQVNPMTYVRGDIPPLIVVQGSNDSTAPIADSLRLVANLKAAGADVTMHQVVGASHGFTDATWPDAESAMFRLAHRQGNGEVVQSQRLDQLAAAILQEDSCCASMLLPRPTTMISVAPGEGNRERDPARCRPNKV